MMRSRKRREELTQTVVEECRHHWVLTEPRDDVIDAVCKRCRARRSYPAQLEMTERFDDYQELTTRGEPISTLRFSAVEEW